MPKPWRSEAEAFRTLVYFVIAVAVIIAVILIVRAVT
jgi:hypothetical protein